MSNLENAIGLGVAGNFAGHLEQAGEAESFKDVKVKEAQAPKALFPFYIPAPQSGIPAHLKPFPLSSECIEFPNEGDNLQIEPEVAVLWRIQYENTRDRVKEITPVSFAAYNDCSIRNPLAKKISQKKNWGKNTKGVSRVFIDIDKFQEGGVMDRYRIACYLNRNGEFIEYGIDSPVKEYNYFHEKLKNWIIEKMNTQQNEGPESPLENIFECLAAGGFPQYALVSIGATRYTEFGQHNFLQVGDKSIVVAYDGALYTPDTMKNRITRNDLTAPGISALIQDII